MRQVLIGWTAAHQAVFGNPPVCLRMFCDANASLACPDKDGLTPGHLAAQWGNVRCVSVLRHAGVSFGLRDNQGCKPKDVAVLYKQKSAVDFLVSLETMPGADVSRRQFNHSQLGSARVCRNCYMACVPGKLCSRCKPVAYCGRACQAEHGQLGFQKRACVQRVSLDTISVSRSY